MYFCIVKCVKTYFLIFFLLFRFAFLMGQNMSTMGTDFWFGFLPGENTSSLSVTITSRHNCEATLSRPLYGWECHADIPANQTVTIVLDSLNLNNGASGVIFNKGVHLTTTDTVSVYVSSFSAATFDASFVLPTEALRNEYMVQTFESSDNGHVSEILVIATEDSTIIDIDATATTLNVSEQDYSVHYMRAGDCLLMKCNSYEDYTGTVIKSRDCKPISVFAGHKCAYIPVDQGTYCDMLFEQCIPTAYWGRRFVAVKTLNHGGDYYKVTSLSDNNLISIDGVPIDYFDKGETYTFAMLSQPGVTRYVETSKPATLYSYMLSMNMAGPDGDPSMMLVPPIEQQITDAVFLNYNNAGQITRLHSVNVVTMADNIDNIYLDGTSIANQFQPVPGNRTYSFARINVNGSSHHLYSTSDTGFVGHAYGVGANESYGYALGFSVIPIGHHIMVDDMEYESGDTIRVCFGDTMAAMMVSLGNVVASDVWMIDGVAMPNSDTLYHALSRKDTFSLWGVAREDGECHPLHDTVKCVVVVKRSEHTYIDTVVCDGTVTFEDTVCDTTGTFLFRHTNTEGCDSNITIRLNILHSTVGYTTVEACDSVRINGILYLGADTVDYDVLEGSNGCDSLVRAVININSSYRTTETVYIDAGSSLLWHDGERYWSSDQHPSYTFTSVDGCDSVVTLNLKLVPHPYVDSSVLWVPNAIITSDPNNNEFRVKGYGIIEMRVSIYTRRGSIVTTYDGIKEAWDGTCRGNTCPEETYVYLIEYRSKWTPEYLQQKMGTVTLLR